MIANQKTFDDIRKDNTNMPINPNLIMFLDTATVHTGYSLFERGKIQPIVFTLLTYGVISVPNHKDWEVRCLNMSAKISNIIHTIKPGALVMEYPHFQGGSAKGQQAARSGSTLQLAYLCGRVSVAWELYITKVGIDTGQLPPLARFVEYREWNGQLTKKHTCQRLEEHFHIKVDPGSVDNNAADAIMMGKWYLKNHTEGEVLGANQADRIDL